MLCKIVTLVLFASATCGGALVMIKHKDTGLVLDGADNVVKMRPWAMKDSQLWISKPAKTAGAVIFQNLASGKVLDMSLQTHQILIYSEHGYRNQQFVLNPNGTITTVYSRDRPIQLTSCDLLADTASADDDPDKWLVVSPLY